MRNKTVSAPPRWKKIYEKSFAAVQFGFVAKLVIQRIKTRRNGIFHRVTILKGPIIHTVVKARTLEEAIENAKYEFERATSILHPSERN